MQIDAVITQLKTYASIFGGRVAGAAELAAVLDQTWLQYPAAYVVPGDFTATDNESAVGLRQTLTEEVVIVVAFDNSADRRGQSVAEQYFAVRASINAAILNWRPDWNPTTPATNIETRGFAISRGALGQQDRGRLFYEYTYSIETYLTDDDGWQLPSVPLVQIGGTITNGGTDLAVDFATNFGTISP